MSSIERKIDKLGRIVLPIGYRNKLGLKENSSVIISLEEGNLILTPKEGKCLLCGKNTELYKDFLLCMECVDKIKNE